MIWVIPKTKSGKIYEPVNEDAVRIDDTLYVSTEYAARCCQISARQFHGLYYAKHLEETEEV